MQLNPREFVPEFAHLLQREMFPLLESVSGPLSVLDQLVQQNISRDLTSEEWSQYVGDDLPYESQKEP